MNTKLVLITGAGSGIGLHLAQTLQKKGHSFLLIDLTLTSLKLYFSELVDVQFFAGDISKAETWEEIKQWIHHQRLQVSHLFNCAGVVKSGFVRDLVG